MSDHRTNHISPDGKSREFHPTTEQIDEARLTAFALGELEERFAGDLTARLETDPAFRQEVESVRATADKLRAELRAEPAMELTALQRERVKQGPNREPVGAGAASSERSILFRSRAVWGAVGLAAAACLVLVAVWPLMTDTARDQMTRTVDDFGGERAAGGSDPLFRSERSQHELGKDAGSDVGALVDRTDAPAADLEGLAATPAPTVSPPSASDSAIPGRGAPVDSLATRENQRSAVGGRQRGLHMVTDPDPSAQAMEESEALAREPAPREAATLDDRMDDADVADQLDERIGDERDFNAEEFARIHDNPFKRVYPGSRDLPTLSVDVDTGSYSNVRRFIMDEGRMPPPDAVRIEEMLNYFNYDYEPPSGDTPFSVNTEVSVAPWNPNHRLLKIGLKGRTIDMGMRAPTSLTFLLDVSGSMKDANKLPLVQRAMKMLVNTLTPDDRIAIVVYANAAAVVLPPTFCHDRNAILEAIDALNAGGSTNGEGGIRLAYSTAEQMFIQGGNNRVIACTDGDFNIGASSEGEITRLIEQKRETGVFLTVLGFGTGNLKENKLEQLADTGNGVYAYIDGEQEARKVLVDQAGATLVTIAKDVKLQVDFNSRHVQGYRLIGYENRVLAPEDFADDSKDAGEIGAGHTVTALFEIVPHGVTDVAFAEKPASAFAANGQEAAPARIAGGDDVRRRTNEQGRAGGLVTPPGVVDEARGADDRARAADADNENDLLKVYVRYKQPDGNESTPLETSVRASEMEKASIDEASTDQKFAAAVAEFAMLLRNSPEEHRRVASFDQVLELAEAGAVKEKERSLLVLRFEDLLHYMMVNRPDVAAGSVEVLASAGLTDAEWNWLLLNDAATLGRAQAALDAAAGNDAFEEAIALLRPHVERVTRNPNGPRRPVAGPGYREEFIEIVKRAKEIAAMESGD